MQTHCSVSVYVYPSWHPSPTKSGDNSDKTRQVTTRVHFAEWLLSAGMSHAHGPCLYGVRVSGLARSTLG